MADPNKLRIESRGIALSAGKISKKRVKASLKFFERGRVGRSGYLIASRRKPLLKSVSRAISRGMQSATESALKGAAFSLGAALRCKEGLPRFSRPRFWLWRIKKSQKRRSVKSLEEKRLLLLLLFCRAREIVKMRITLTKRAVLI